MRNCCLIVSEVLFGWRKIVEIFRGKWLHDIANTINSNDMYTSTMVKMANLGM